MNCVTYMKICLLGILLFAIFFVFNWGAASQNSPVRLILDTDISSDVDDVGAVAVLHALADRGDAQILAMMASSADPWSASCLDALNTWFGRPDIPIGTVQEESVLDESKYTSIIANEFPHDLRYGQDVPDAVSLYRNVLAQQDDASVVLVSVGYLTNLSNLLQSEPDAISPLGGQALVRKKVKKLVCMGGKYPKGHEWNFYRDAASTDFVLKKWPTSIIFCGYEIGQQIMTGAPLISLPKRNPLRRSYFLYNGVSDRSSWDQVTVMYAVLGNRDPQNGLSWRLSLPGRNEIDSKGRNRWIFDPDALSRFLILQSSNKGATEVINQLMLESAK